MPVTVKCVVCDTPFSVVPSREKTAKYCSPKCQLERAGFSRKRAPSVTRVCAHCGDEFELRGSVAKSADKAGGMKGRFCSPSCASSHYKHTDETRARLREVRRDQAITPAMLKALEGGRRWAKGLTKESHPSIARRAKILSEKYTGTENPEHSKRMRQYYTDHPEKHPNILMTRRGFISKPERMMRGALKDAEINAKWQHRIGRYFADFAVIEKRVVIEVDGTYWHDPESDAIRDAFMRDRGWKVLRFTDKEILANLSECVDAICEELQHVTATPSTQLRLLP